MTAAQTAIVILEEVEVVELHREGIEGQQGIGQQLAGACDVLDGFGGLQRTTDARDAAQYTHHRAGLDLLLSGRFWKDAAVAGCAWYVRHQLTLEAVDTAHTEGLALHHAGIVDEILDGEVVRSVYHEVVLLDHLPYRILSQVFFVLDHLHIGVEGSDGSLGRLYFRVSYIFGAMYDLSLQIGERHAVAIGYAQCPYSCSCEVECNGRTESTCTHDEHTGLEELLLPLRTYTLQDEVAVVSSFLF